MAKHIVCLFDKGEMTKNESKTSQLQEIKLAEISVIRGKTENLRISAS